MWKDECDKNIIYVGPNHVEVQYSLYNEAGERVIIPEMTETYGLSRAQTELSAKQEEINYWQRMTPEVIATKITLLESEAQDLYTIISLLNQAVGNIKP